MNPAQDETPTRITEWHEPVMGTAVEVQLVLTGADADAEGRSYISAAVEEMVRLQNIFSSVDPTSEFSRWARNDITEISTELTQVLTESAQWQRSSGGRFNPAVADLTEFWNNAQSAMTMPDAVSAQNVADAIASPRWQTGAYGSVEQLGDCSVCTLNAFAKGWIVDRAVEHLLKHHSVRTVTVNAGGDLRRSGADPLIVGIENPFRPFDNEPPIAAISVTNAAVATSGSARKGFRIGGKRFGHVIDPRSGWPVEATVSLSVVADTGATADALATILGVQQPTDAITEANEKGIPIFIVDCDGRQFRSEPWNQIEVDLS
jgi:FAD:protein FMN transferase